MKPVIPAWLLRAQCREHEWISVGWITEELPGHPQSGPNGNVLGYKGVTFLCKKCCSRKDVPLSELNEQPQ